MENTEFKPYTQELLDLIIKKEIDTVIETIFDNTNGNVVDHVYTDFVIKNDKLYATNCQCPIIFEIVSHVYSDYDTPMDLFNKYDGKIYYIYDRYLMLNKSKEDFPETLHEAIIVVTAYNSKTYKHE